MTPYSIQRVNKRVYSVFFYQLGAGFNAVMRVRDVRGAVDVSGLN